AYCGRAIECRVGWKAHCGYPHPSSETCPRLLQPLRTADVDPRGAVDPVGPDVLPLLREPQIRVDDGEGPGLRHQIENARRDDLHAAKVQVLDGARRFHDEMLRAFFVAVAAQAAYGVERQIARCSGLDH